MDDKSSENATVLIIRAFARIKEQTPDFYEVVDDLLFAATAVDSVEVKPASTNSLSAKLANRGASEIALPLGMSSFRSVLARVGTICHSASTKSTLRGKFRAWLSRKKILSDTYCTEAEGQRFIYRSCRLEPIVGSPLYALDATLQICDRKGAAFNLKITMNNSLGHLFLKIVKA